MDQRAFSRWPRRAAATARHKMDEPKYWWKGNRMDLISGENLGKRNAENPSAH